MKNLTDAQRGVMFALAAHLIWGAMAPFLGLIRFMNPFEVGIHRGLWSVPLAGIVVYVLGLFPEVFRVLKNPKTLAILALTSSVVFFNWIGYIWCIQTGRALEASLGYFIQPLLNVAAGYVFLNERFSKPQWVAIGVAALGVLMLSFATGVFPFWGMFLAISFCLYGLLRKMVSVSPVSGFFVEVIILAGPFLAIAYYLSANNLSHFGTSLFNTAMLIGAAGFTTSALIFYAQGLKALRYSTSGLIQYVTPSLIFLTAVFLFGETLNVWKLVAFMLVWLALAIYSWAMLRDSAAK